MNKEKQPPGLMLYFADIRPALQMLTDEQIGRIFRAVMNYAENGERPQIEGIESLVFAMLTPKIDRDRETYGKKLLHANYMAYCRKFRDSGQDEKEKLTEEQWIQLQESNCQTSTSDYQTSTSNYQTSTSDYQSPIAPAPAPTPAPTPAPATLNSFAHAFASPGGCKGDESAPAPDMEEQKRDMREYFEKLGVYGN